MRRILADLGLSRRRSRRDGELSRVTPEEAVIQTQSRTDVVAVDDALKSPAKIGPRKGRGIVDLAFFGRPSTEETAEVLKTPRAQSSTS